MVSRRTRIARRDGGARVGTGRIAADIDVKSTAADGRDFGYQPTKLLADGAQRLGYGTTKHVPAANAALTAVRDIEWVREQLTPHTESYINVLLADMHDRHCYGHRGAMRAIPELMGWAGMQEELLRTLLEQLQLQSHAQLIMAAKLFVDSQRSTIEDAEREAVKVIRARVKSDPKRRDTLMRQCFGVLVDAEFALDGEKP